MPAGRGYAGVVRRSGPLLSFVAAALGVAVALAVAHAGGWLSDGGSETLVVSSPALEELAPEPAVRSSAKPLLGNGFDPAAIYASRSPGVVTIRAEFGGGVESQGSGFVVSRDGLVLTNSHVITSTETGEPEGADRLYVEFSDGDRAPAKVVGWDVFDDVGVIRVDPSDHAVDPVPIGRSADVRVGDPVAIIGSPFGNENSLAVGVVAATRRSIASLTSQYDLLDAIQTDAPINHGNSGGPMFDARGRVIGIAAQIRSSSGTAEGVGFAVPIDSAQRSLRQLLRDGKVRYAYAGIKAQTLTPSIARKFGFPVERGAIVTGVQPGSPASAAGLQQSTQEEELNGVAVGTDGDVVVAVNGARVDAAEDLVRIVSSRLEPGQVAKLTIYRGKGLETVALRLAERPAQGRR
jgi:S1-C subfamily serine protease